VIDANSVPRDFRQTIHLKTTKPQPGSRLAGNFDSEIEVRHDAPSATHVEAVVFTDQGPERHETLHIDTTLYWKAPNGQWMAMDPARMIGGNPVVPSLHDRYGPRGFVRAIQPGNFAYLGTGACEGVLDGDTCFSFHFVDNGFDHNAYVSVNGCLLRSVIGENEEGPLSIVIHYDDQQVERPRPGGR
jgi:hypothetical protein